ncbi:MAG TPA: biopolymer transporter ExbD [Gemmatimonadaceae bacterium]
MAFTVGKADSLNNEPNVVPMIDVLLVLLIIFMLVVPMSRKALDLQLPDPTPSESQGPPPSQIVLEVMPGNRYAINKEPVTRDALAGRLKEIYDPRPDKIIFVKGDPKLKYDEVIWAMDIARGSGVRVIGVPPKDNE